MPVQFCFGSLMPVVNGNQTPIMDASTFTSETIVASGANQQTTAVAVAASYAVCRVTSSDAAVYVAFGTSPNALSGTGTRALIPSGGFDYFAVTPGQKGAVVLA